MPKLIAVPCGYCQVPSSKEMTIEVEIKTGTTANAIKKFLCMDQQMEPISKDSNIDHSQLPVPHEAVMLANIIEGVKGGVVNLKCKKDNPVQIDFGVVDGKFLLSVSFLADNSAFKEVSKLLVDKVFDRRVEIPFKKLTQVAKAFCNEHEKDKIMRSMLSMHSDIEMIILAKNAEEQMMGMIKKYIVAEIEKKAIVPDSNPLDMSFVPKDDVYVEFSEEKRQLGDALFALLLVSLNMQNVDFIVHKDKLFIKKGELRTKIRDNCKKFMKERLTFTDKKKAKPYAGQSKEYKEKVSAEQHKEKMELEKAKKVLGLIEVIYSQGAYELENKKKIQDDLYKMDLDSVLPHLTNIHSALTDIIKAK